MTDLRAQSGNVDRDGDIVDVLLGRIRRLYAAIGPDRAAGVEREEQLELVLRLIASGKAATQS